MKITKKIGLLLISIMVFTSAVVVWGYGTVGAPIKLTSSNRYIQYYSIKATNTRQELTDNKELFVKPTRVNDDFVVECQNNELKEDYTYYRCCVLINNSYFYPASKETKVKGVGSNTGKYDNVALTGMNKTLQIRVEPRFYSSYLNEGCWSPNMYK